jgi:hypothetical protein
MIVLPAMSEAQAASWHALMDVHDRLSTGWTLIGGQLVHLHCAERDSSPPRPTDDADTVIDVRASVDMLQGFTQALLDLGFTSAGISGDGYQHRWIKDQAMLDVLLPEGIGRTAASRTGATGSPTLSTPGGTQALLRSESVAVTVEGRQGFVRRPSLVGALVVKAAAHTTPVGELAKRRHRLDFATLASLVAARDFRDEDLTRKDRSRLREMIALTRADRDAISMPGALESLTRLERAASLTY